MNTVYLNGRYVAAQDAQISVFDRGFLFGDSIYEVIPYYRGVGFRLEEHLQRLRHSLRAVRIDAELDWVTMMDELVQLNGGGNLSVYLQVSRGNAGKRIAAYSDDLEATVFACCNPIRDIYQDGADQVEGISAVVVADQRWLRCDIKATGLLPNILVLQQARDQGAAEALLIRDEVLTEGTSSNLFIVKQGVLYTPKRSSEILGGITRELVLDLADENGIQYQEIDIDYETLTSADEVWISSSTRAVVPVIEIDNQPVADGAKGPLWRQMFELFTGYQRRLMTGE